VEGVLADGGVGGLAWLPGERSDVVRVLRGLDVFALPSLAEGISNTILEAMACGLPVVATRVGGNPELVTEGATGRLVPASDPLAMASALLDYANDPAKARRHGAAGRSRVEAAFSIDRMVRDYDSLYQTLLGRAGVPAANAGACARM
jgi:glycosyltransferase involved in cell wall biosynthesis